MSAVDFSIILNKLLPDLLYDISIGHGDDLLPVPTCDENVDAKTKAEYEELISFWGGAQSVRKSDLFASIFAYCLDDTLLTDMTTCIISHYPKLTPKLDVDGLKNLFQKAVDQAQAEVTAEIRPAPEKIAMPAEESKIIPPAPGAKPIIHEVKRPSKGSEKAQSAAYRDFVESKKETMAMRNLTG